ncbi:MAG: VWA domain-containing protein [Planctomycetes bacterium]|nr:VWA domain-containing protein [Planctomycetota bacterium]
MTEKQNFNKKRPINISNLLGPGIRRPNWICLNVRQIVVLVRDKSSSMTGEKAIQATEASQELVRELARPENKDGFYVSVVDFSEQTDITHPLQQAKGLDGHVKRIQPYLGTNITTGLETALRTLQTGEKAQEEGIQYLRPVVICFSDGCHNVGNLPYGVADKIKQQADLVTVAYGSNADVKLLKKLASTSQHYYKCSNGKELRQFLAAVGETMSATMASGINATEALSKVRRTR